MKPSPVAEVIWQKWQTFADTIFLNMTICCFPQLYIIGKWIFFFFTVDITNQTIWNLNLLFWKVAMDTYRYFTLYVYVQRVCIVYCMYSIYVYNMYILCMCSLWERPAGVSALLELQTSESSPAGSSITQSCLCVSRRIHRRFHVWTEAKSEKQRNSDWVRSSQREGSF